MAPIDVGPPLAGVLSTAVTGLGTPLPPIPPPLYVDGWDGYRGERQKILSFIDQKNVKDVVVLTGDYHESFAAHLPVDRSTWQLDKKTAAVEFIAPAITSPGLSEVLQMGNLPEALTVNSVFEANLTASNPWVTYHEGFQNGYAVAEFRADGMQYDFFFLDNRNAANTGAHHGTSWKVPRGASVLTQTADPLGPRPPIHVGAPATPQPTGVIPRTGADQSVALVAGAAAAVAVGISRIASLASEEIPDAPPPDDPV
jgi:alkaline phosphatase D